MSQQQRFGETVFQYWDSGSFHDYDGRQQSMLRDAFLTEPPQITVDLGTYAVYRLNETEDGYAFQRNKTTNYERPIRLKPPFLLRRGDPTSWDPNYGNNIGGTLPLQSKSWPVIQISGIPESSVTSLPLHLQNPTIQWEQLGPRGMGPQGVTPSVWTNLENDVAREICLSLCQDPMPARVVVSVDGQRMHLESVATLQRPGGIAYLVNERNTRQRYRVRILRKVAFWSCYSEIMSTSFRIELENALKQGSSILSTGVSTVVSGIGSFFGLADPSSSSSYSHSPPPGGAGTGASPFFEFLETISDLVVTELVQHIKNCDKYPRDGELKVAFELDSSGGCFHRKQKEKVQVRVSSSASSQRGIFQQGAALGSHLINGQQQDGSRVLQIVFSNLDKLEENESRVEVKQWREILEVQSHSPEAKRPAIDSAQQGGNKGQGVVTQQPAKPQLPNNASLFASNSSLFASNSSVAQKINAPQSGNSQTASSSSTGLGVPAHPRSQSPLKAVKKVEEITSGFFFQLAKGDLPYGDGRIELPAGLEVSKLNKIESFSTPILRLSNPPCTICLDDGNEECLKLDCGHEFHKECVVSWFKSKTECPICKKGYGTVTGKQPDNGTMEWSLDTRTQLAGFQSAGTICVTFSFPPGVSEGQAYNGRTEKGYLPYNLQGIFLLEMFKVAFRRRLMFGMGIRITMQIFGPTFNIHIKTTTKPVGRERHGFPDDGYFSRTMDELSANKILPKDLA